MKIHKYTLALDLDGTLRQEAKTFDKIFAKPLNYDIKQIVRRLYDSGQFFIIIFTACGWPEYHSVKSWLDDHHIPYHTIVCGKPNYDFIVDDRSTKSLSELMKIIQDKNILT